MRISCSAFTRTKSSALETNEHSSSRRVATIRSRLSASVASGASTFTGRAGELLELGQVHVGIAALAERVGQRLDVVEDIAQRLARKARLVDLEHRTQSPAGDAHVMDALDVRGVEDALGMLEELLRPDRDRPRGRLAEAEVGMQPGYIARFGHPANEYSTTTVEC